MSEVTTAESGGKTSEKKRKRCMTIDIEKFTKIGNNELQRGNVANAIEAFQLAYRRAILCEDAFTERACAFNLGAVFIAAHKSEKGLEYLQRAIPPMNRTDGKSNGDLYFNFALGYELLKNSSEMLKYLELAYEQYRLENDNLLMESTVASRLAKEYTLANDSKNAAKYYGIGADLYEKLPDSEEDMLNALNQSTKHLAITRDKETCKQQLDRCLKNVSLLKDPQKQGKLFNDLGLTYTQCGDFAKACEAFEQALPLSQGPSGDKKREAVLLQNIGAIYNSLGDYQKAIEIHEKAIQLHGEQHSRASQGQCFINLAFAHSQLGDEDSAGESYLHAIQASKDSGDFKSQWQSLEGLGAVAFNRGNIDKSITYFKQALSVMAKAKHDNIAQERIITKLTDALQHKVLHAVAPRPQSRTTRSDGERPRRYSRPIVTAAPPDKNKQIIPLFVNDLERSVSREVETSNLRRRSRSGSVEHYYLGLSEYDTDTDRSLRILRKKKSSRRAKNLGAVDEPDMTVENVSQTKSKPTQGKSEKRIGKRRVVEADSFRRRTGGRKQLLALQDWRVEQKKYDQHRKNEIEATLGRKLDSNTMLSTSKENVPKNVAAYAALMERQESAESVESSSMHSESMPSTSHASRNRRDLETDRKSVDESESEETVTPSTQSESEEEVSDKASKTDDGPQSPRKEAQDPETPGKPIDLAALVERLSPPSSSPTREIEVHNRRPITAVKKRPIGSSEPADNSSELRRANSEISAEPHYERIDDSSDNEVNKESKPVDDADEEPIYATINSTRELKSEKDEKAKDLNDQSESETIDTDSDSESESTTGSSYSSTENSTTNDKEPLISTYEKPIPSTSESSVKSPNFFRNNDEYTRLDKPGRSKAPPPPADDDDVLYASIDTSRIAKDEVDTSQHSHQNGEQDLSKLPRADREEKCSEKMMFDYQRQRDKEDGVVHEVIKPRKAQSKYSSRLCLVM